MTESNSMQAVWDGMNRSIELSSRMTDAQHLAIAYGLGELIGGTPDAFFGVKRDPCQVGEVFYTFSWVKGGAFGRAEVEMPDEGHSAAPPMQSWIRPLSDVRKIDVGFNVTNPRVVRSEYIVKLRIIAHWDDEAVDLDATGSMNTYARPALEELIRLVLDRTTGRT